MGRIMSLDDLRVSVEPPPLQPRRRQVTEQFTRVSLPDMGVVGRCRTGRAAGLYLLLLRQSQLDAARAARIGKPVASTMRVSKADRDAAGLGDDRAMRRATQELVDLGLVRRILRSGRASLLELVRAGP